MRAARPTSVLATATPTLAALRPAHEHARAEHTRHARCTRASLATDARALTLQHALARQKQGWRARVNGHRLTVGRPAAGTSCSHTLSKHARQLRCSRAPYITHTLCMLSTTTVATVCREMMTMSEMMTYDTMKKTKDTMDDARECAPLAPAPPMRNGALASTRRERARAGSSPQHVLLKRRPLRSPYHALIASPRASPARSWQQMMRARLGLPAGWTLLRRTQPWAQPTAPKTAAPLTVREMHVVSSIGSWKKRSKTCQVIRRRGRYYVIDKKNPRNKARQGGAKMKPWKKGK